MSLTWVSNDGTTWPFDGSIGVTVVGDVEGVFTIPTDLVIDQRVGFDGGLVVNSRYAPRRVTLELLLVDTFEVLSLWRGLLRALAAGGNLQYEGPYGRKQLRSCRLEGPDRSMTGQDLQFRIDDVIPVSLVALDPRWTDSELTTVVLPISVSTAYDAPIAYDAVIPYTGGSSRVVTVVGDAEAYPDFYIRGPFTTLTVSLGEASFQLANALADGVEMTVTADTATETVNGGRGPKLASDSRVDWSLLTEGSLLPGLPVGSSSIVVGGTGTGINSACWVFWVSRWLTP